jgi:hypothetical protein
MPFCKFARRFAVITANVILPSIQTSSNSHLLNGRERRQIEGMQLMKLVKLQPRADSDVTR